MLAVLRSECPTAEGSGFSFSSPDLDLAGRYTAAAVFEETRPELVRAIGKRDLILRSAALELHVQPDEPAALLMLGQVQAMTIGMQIPHPDHALCASWP